MTSKDKVDYTPKQIKAINKIVHTNPLTQSVIDYAYKAGVLKIDTFEDKKFYRGACRNADLAIWDGEKQEFIYIRHKFTDTFPETIKTIENDDGHDLFIPVYEELEVEDGLKKRLIKVLEGDRAKNV